MHLLSPCAAHTPEGWQLCRALRVVNPSPYMIYMQARGSILVASSPEILCRVGHARTVTNMCALSHAAAIRKLLVISPDPSDGRRGSVWQHVHTLVTK